MEYLIILYLLFAVGVLYWVFRKKKKKVSPSQKVEELMLKQAEELDEKSEILIEVYEELRKKKDWIPNVKNKDSEVADLTRSQSAESGNKKGS